ncbi:MAG: hypothetical protein IJ126_01830 [Lachnospiraceae bacterium]|jgi:hypothetical protein|nr:hypothetical protein [Lachnospiraceae bacterium]
MNINQVAADLEMVGCSVRNLSITNDLISIRDDDELHLDLDILPVYEGIIEQEHRGRVVLNLHIDSVRKEREDQKMEISVTFEALFRSTDSMEEQAFIELLIINGATALYSLARGKIEAISASIFLDGKIVLPFVNIIQYYHQKYTSAENYKDLIVEKPTE